MLVAPSGSALAARMIELGLGVDSAVNHKGVAAGGCLLTTIPPAGFPVNSIAAA